VILAGAIAVLSGRGGRPKPRPPPAQPVRPPKGGSPLCSCSASALPGGPLRGWICPVRSASPRPFARKARSVSVARRHGGPAHPLRYAGRCQRTGSPVAARPTPARCHRPSRLARRASSQRFGLRPTRGAQGGLQPPWALAPARPPVRPPRGLPFSLGVSVSQPRLRVTAGATHRLVLP